MATKQLPKWNQHPFVCPGCQRSFATNTIRIMNYAGHWHCHACVNLLTHRAAGLKQPRVTPTQELASSACHTCGQDFKKRRIVVNVHGQLVHYRCPKRRATV